MSYDKEIVKNILKEKDLSGEYIDYDKVFETAEYDNGQYIFTVGNVGFVFEGNTLVDAMPGWKGLESIK